MRVRSSTQTTPAVGSQSVWQYAGTCSNPELTTGPVVTEIFWDKETVVTTMEDVVTPNFHRRVAAGEIINNPMVKTVVITTNGEMQSFKDQKYKIWTTSCSPDKYVYYGSKLSGTGSSGALAACLLPAPAIDVPRLKNIALTNAYAKADVSEAAMLVTLAELDKTKASLISIFYRTVRILKALRKWRIMELKRQIKPKELADRYMEARYALRPLVYDVLGIIDGLNSELKKNDRFTSRGYASDYGMVSRNQYVFFSTTYQEATAASTTTINVEARAGVMNHIVSLSKFSIFGADQIFNSAWDLIPFSFIVDWFFNVGKTIAAHTTSYGLKQLASWVTVTTTTNQTAWVDSARMKYTPPIVVASNYTCTGNYSVVTVRKEREPNPQLSSWPSIDVRLDWAKLLDLTIILKNLMT